ncbi:DUF4231 domain-containing protein [Mucilaginibacter gossypii]|uniref:DUF4231 domain-containing protein n=1 Tax=Mucilaginibacter gossypii TaxID=551996 RepID=A0A1G8DDW9_9SPHI|nr:MULTISPECIES: DUF4231 domain-containing protein [Mucilaginibacter]QTE38154.1 DUF4231 domain-containing protein [Mucilaginibacter gossypii]RAV60369.1 DUF4231 domain-containing protein [Mucilaginibacter rubeus]SDH55831.1 Protein of unknown function [Mucilaginibacter gossypii]
MEQNDFQKYVEDRYRHQMEYYKTTSAKNHRLYRNFQWTLIILSLLTPVFTALKLGGNAAPGSGLGVDWTILTLIISSAVAILTTALKTFNYQELWVTARTTYEQLKPEIHYYNFNLGPYAKPDQNKEGLFVTRVEAILSSEHDLWPPAKMQTEKK